MPVTDHYGELVYTAIDETLADPFLRSQLSAPTLASVGSFLVSAYEVSAAGWEGGAITAVFDIAMDIAFDVAAELAAELMDLVSDIVPILLSILEAIFNIFQTITEADKLEQQKKRAEAAQKCREKARLYEAIATGAQGFKPADYFMQATRGEITPEGVPEWEVSGRMPFIGRLIELVTEQQYNNFYLEWGLGSGTGTGPAGGQNKAVAADLMGIPLADFKVFGGETLDAKTFRKAGGPYCHPPMWPISGNYRPAFKRLRKAILAQSIAARQAAGMTPGDGGSSLWPLYQDLIYSAVRVQQWPAGPSSEGKPGYSPVPPLNEPLLRMLYKGGFGGPTVVLGLKQSVKLYQANKSDLCTKKNPWIYDRAIELGADCVGNWDSGINAFMRMVDEWGYNVRPVYADDQVVQAEMLEQTYTAMSIAVRDRLSQMDLIKPGPGVTAGTAGQAIAAITKLRKQGLITESAALEGARAVNGGAKPSVFPAVLAAAALGFVLLKGRG